MPSDSPKREAQKKAREMKRGSGGGLENTQSYVSRAISALVPQMVAKRSLSVSLDTDKDVYRVGEPVFLDIKLKNRLPVPVNVQTPKQRLWGWKFDGLLEASDERIYTHEIPNAISFRGSETKRISHEWRGKIKTSDESGTRWVLPRKGEHELEAFIATGTEKRPTDKKTIEFK